MKFGFRYLLALFLLASSSVITLSQGFTVESNSPPSATGADIFISLEGKFSIALPQNGHGYEPKTYEEAGAYFAGDAFIWMMKEGRFVAEYVNTPRVLEDPALTTKVFDGGRAGMISKLGNGKLVSEKSISLMGHPGREYRVELPPDGAFITRNYVVGKRFYQVHATFRTDLPGNETVATKILDSFKFLADAEVDAAVKQKIAQATPALLPQAPVTPKAASDVEDEGLRGKVQIVLTESQQLSGSAAARTRTPTLRDYYNVQGNLTKKEWYDWRGNFSGIEVFGYLDGVRVSHLGEDIPSEYNPPDVMITDLTSSPRKPEPKSDPRYSNKLTYKYDIQRRLIEDTQRDNYGKLRSRTVYKYKGNQKEVFGYVDGKLNEHTLYTHDDKNNKIEKIDFDTKGGSISEKDSFAYEFDDKGNWVKQTTSKWVTKDGRSYYEAVSISYRTITYY